MTAKNRIIISIIAIITTLVVAGSMVFIIFAATRGSIGGGVTIEYSSNYSLHGSIASSYTQNGTDWTPIKSSDGSDKIYLQGWQDEESVVKSFEETEIELTLENQWVIYKIELRITEPQGQSGGYIRLSQGTKMSNVDIKVYCCAGKYEGVVNPETLEAETGWWSSTQLTLQSNQYDCYIVSGSETYVVFSVSNPSQDASFDGGIMIQGIAG